LGAALGTIAREVADSVSSDGHGSRNGAEGKAEELNATDTAVRTAEELEVDLEDLEGSGPQGRITIRDVKRVEHAKKG
jgi:pyruvate/2-oxoglutarate dehydrogenase complex dihydrolipoamide acyltransferase (E2) component